MVMLRIDAHAACDRAAGHAHAVLVIGNVATSRDDAFGDDSDAVGLLDPQFGNPEHSGGALGLGRGNGEDRIFVDHRGGAFGRNIDAAKPAVANTKIGDCLAALGTLVANFDIAAHFLKRGDQACAKRVHADPGYQQVTALGDEGRHHRKSR